MRKKDKGMKWSHVTVALVLGSTGVPATWSAPVLSFVSGSTGLSSASIAQGTSSWVVNLELDTGGLPVGGVQFHVETSPSEAIRYGTTPVTALSTPFTAADLIGPSAGAVVRRAGGEIAFFKNSVGDYSAFPAQPIASLSLDTSTLTPGTYTVTPVGEEFVNTNVDLSGSDFGAATPFALTITTVPEPAAAVVLLLGAIGFAVGRPTRVPSGQRRVGVAKCAIFDRSIR